MQKVREMNSGSKNQRSCELPVTADLLGFSQLELEMAHVQKARDSLNHSTPFKPIQNMPHFFPLALYLHQMKEERGKLLLPTPPPTPPTPTPPYIFINNNPTSIFFLFPSCSIHIHSNPSMRKPPSANHSNSLPIFRT